MSTIDQRANKIYAFLLRNLNQGFVIGDLLARTGLQPGAKTTEAIKRARALAVADGLHFPPAISPGWLYKVTNLRSEAILPAVRMSRIADGVTARANVGYDFAAAGLADLTETERAVVLVQNTARQSMAAVQAAVDDATMALLKAHRQVRAEAAREAARAANGAVTAG